VLVAAGFLLFAYCLNDAPFLAAEVKNFPLGQLNHGSAERLGPPRKQLRQPLKTRP